MEIVMPVVPMFHVNAWGLPFSATMVGATLAFPGPHLDAPSEAAGFARTSGAFDRLAGLEGARFGF